MISFSHINKQYGRQVLFVDASFQLNPGEKVGLVGPNGSGKTTIFRMITGEEVPDEGEIVVPKKLSIGYFRQDVEEMAGRSVLDEVTAGSGRVGDLHHELEQLNHAMSDPGRAGEMDAILARFGEVQEEYEHLGGYALEARAREVLHGLGFDDERIAGDVRARAVREANREAAYARQQAMLAKEQRFIERFAAHAAKAAQVQSRVKALEKIEKIELPKKRQVVKFDFRSPPRSGEQVAVLEGITKAYGRRVVHDGLNLTIRRGERWCVMGKNGAGKSTLLKMVAGQGAPDNGSVRLGASLKMGYFAQQALDLLDADLTVEEQLQRDFPHESIGVLRNLAGAFQFSGDEVDKKIRALSGGEKTRLVLARMLLDPPNFLVLDEPTNHLDLATKDMLLDSLGGFDGTMLFVSHDRAFLRGLSNRVLELGGESGTDAEPHAYPGSYVDYVARTGHEAPGIHR